MRKRNKITHTHTLKQIQNFKQLQKQQKIAPYFEVFDRNVGHDNGEFDELSKSKAVQSVV